MDAIAENFGVKEAVSGSAVAGADIILMCHSLEKQELALAALKESVEKGDLSMDRIDESVERVIRLKQKYKLF
jgi:beta-N-acetylhexosaminidase